MYYLAYGSNLHPARLSKRLGSINCIGVTELAGWQLRFHKRGADGSGKGNLIQAADMTAWAVVYELDDSQKNRLDEFEGDGYECVNMDVTVVQQDYSCFCYLAEPDWINDQLLPHDWYRDLILHGARHAGFTAAYLQLIQSQQVQIDELGRQRHAELLQHMQQAGSLLMQHYG